MARAFGPWMHGHLQGSCRYPRPDNGSFREGDPSAMSRTAVLARLGDESLRWIGG
jgi:hypothetical protein